VTAFQPFAFEREFRDVPIAADSAAEALAEAFALAEARGFAAGEAAAAERLRTEQASRLEEMLYALLGQIDDVEKLAERRAAVLEREAEALAITAAELLAGQTVEAAPAGAITAALTTVLGELRRGMPVTIWVHPDLAAAVEQLVADHQRGERRARSVTISPDSALAPGDARIGWDQGSALVDAAARRSALARILGERAGTAPD